MSKSPWRAVVRKLMMMCLIINLCFKHVKYTALVLFSGRTDMWNGAWNL
jgi:hypothetical protein